MSRGLLTRRILIIQNGIGLVETMVSLGVSVVIMAAIAALFSNQYKNIADIRNKAAALELRTRLIVLTMDQTQCACVLTGQLINPQVDQISLVTVNGVNSLSSIAGGNCNNATIVEAGQSVDPNETLRVDRIELINRGAGVAINTMNVDLQVSFTLVNGRSVIRPVSTRIIAGVNGNSIENCRGVGGGFVPPICNNSGEVMRWDQANASWVCEPLTTWFAARQQVFFYTRLSGLVYDSWRTAGSGAPPGAKIAWLQGYCAEAVVAVRATFDNNTDWQQDAAQPCSAGNNLTYTGSIYAVPLDDQGNFQYQIRRTDPPSYQAALYVWGYGY